MTRRTGCWTRVSNLSLTRSCHISQTRIRQGTNGKPCCSAQLSVMRLRRYALLPLTNTFTLLMIIYFSVIADRCRRPPFQLLLHLYPRSRRSKHARTCPTNPPHCSNSFTFPIHCLSPPSAEQYFPTKNNHLLPHRPARLFRLHTSLLPLQIAPPKPPF